MDDLDFPLVPWPSDPSQVSEALVWLAETSRTHGFNPQSPEDVATLTERGRQASALIGEYAPSAPYKIQNSVMGQAVSTLRGGLQPLQDGQVTRPLAPWAGAPIAMVERYAPEAPDAIKREATTRLAAWLTDRPAVPIVNRGSDISSGQLRYARASHLMMRQSGAEALLQPWRRRAAATVRSR